MMKTLAFAFFLSAFKLKESIAIRFFSIVPVTLNGADALALEFGNGSFGGKGALVWAQWGVPHCLHKMLDPEYSILWTEETPEISNALAHKRDRNQPSPEWLSNSSIWACQIYNANNPVKTIFNTFSEHPSPSFSLGEVPQVIFEVMFRRRTFELLFYYFFFNF